MHHSLTTDLELIGCPACLLPAEVLERFVLESTDGPIEHATVGCAARHRFTVLVEHLGRTRPTDHRAGESEDRPAPTRAFPRRADLPASGGTTICGRRRGPSFPG